MRKRTLMAAVAAAAICLAVVPGAGPAGAAPSRTSLPGSVPSWATGANRAGTADATQQVVFRVYLPWRVGDAAAQYALSASTPGSASAGKFLTAAQFRSRFAPSTADVSGVTSWLKQQGFAIGYTPSNRHYIEASGTIAQAATAFATTFGEYKYSGATLRAPQTALSVPAGLPAISAVVGLDESAALVHPAAAAAPPPDAFVNGTPCSAYWGETTVPTRRPRTARPCRPPRRRSLPAGTPGRSSRAPTADRPSPRGNDGTGVTVAVIDAYASPTDRSNARRTPASTACPRRRTLPRGGRTRHLHPPAEPRQDPEGWGGEETLDIEAVHTMAPGADILYVGAPNNYRDLDAAHEQGRRQAPCRHRHELLRLRRRGAAPGLHQAAGRHPDPGCGRGHQRVLLLRRRRRRDRRRPRRATPTPDWPASSPWVTAVGGTSLGVAQQQPPVRARLGDRTSTWNTAASPGAPPALPLRRRRRHQPAVRPAAYQAGVVPNAIATYGGSGRCGSCRTSRRSATRTPACWSARPRPSPTARYYDEYRIGGTSLSSPLYAGMFALRRQNHGHGLANPALYAARGRLHDVTKAYAAHLPRRGPGRLRQQRGRTGGYTYTRPLVRLGRTADDPRPPGYDDVTGVGSPNGGHGWRR